MTGPTGQDGSLRGASWARSSRARLAALAWFVGQATATLAWWLMMTVSDRVRRWFEMSDDRDVLNSFVLADVVLIVGGSLITAAALSRRAAWAGWAATAVAGAVAYATLYVVAWMMNGGDGWLGLVAMLAATAGSAAAAAVTAQAPV